MENRKDMNQNLALIVTAESIQLAFEKLLRDKPSLNKSKKFDVVYNEEKFPPKEVIREAARIQGIENWWDYNLSGGKATNDRFKKLGYQIMTKEEINSELPLTGNIWKLGCNWGKGKPSFYEFIKDSEIVIGIEDKKYNVGDLILLTEGHQAKAIARVNETPKLVINNKSLKSPFEKFEIEYLPFVNYADAEWYEIKETDSFTYKLQQGIVKVQDEKIIKNVLDLWGNRKNEKSKNNKGLINSNMKALNTILYGPPGTGKTYNTIDLSVEIIQGVKFSHKENKVIFDKLIEDGQIQFVTFHQSLGYEDFIEGIKPVTKAGLVSYEIKDGIFKKIAKIASSNLAASNINSKRLPFKEVLEILNAELNENENDTLIIPMSKKGYSFEITEINDNSIPFKKQSGSSQHSLSIKTLENFYLGKRDSIKGLQPYYLPLRDYLWKYSENQDVIKSQLKNYVLIIDEINRGNVSQIFGELITLIEDDKREGSENEISVVLPYSKENFTVPSNLFIIGTMNTADRSVEALDTALRRRFNFIEMPPLYGLSELDIEVSGVNLGLLLTNINKRIEKLLNKDYQIGHAYFIGVTSEDELRQVFQNKIIPLLQEYFFGDYGKIGLVLGKSFIQEDANSFIGFAANDYEFVSDLLERKVYSISAPEKWDFKSILNSRKD